MEKKTTLTAKQKEILSIAIKAREEAKSAYQSHVNNVENLISLVTGELQNGVWKIVGNELITEEKQTFKEKVETQIREKNLEEIKNEQ
jgi:hypothetical protein